MSICLVGKSCSGKDTIARELVKLGYERKQAGDGPYREWNYRLG